jgi:hypothetical protein
MSLEEIVERRKEDLSRKHRTKLKKELSDAREDIQIMDCTIKDAWRELKEE